MNFELFSLQLSLPIYFLVFVNLLGYSFIFKQIEKVQTTILLCFDSKLVFNFISFIIYYPASFGDLLTKFTKLNLKI
jgi:hypothetical protein